jgi:hypothetical protein
MNFRWGAPPNSISDDALASGEWSRILFPPVWVLHLSALPVGGIMALLPFAAWVRFGPKFSIDFAPPLHVLAAAVMTVTIGVWLQALTQAGTGPSSRRGVGFWPSRLLVYVFRLDPSSKRRFLSQFFVPALALTLTPLLAGLIFRIESGWLLFVSCLAVLCFGQNLLLGVWVAIKVPKGSAMAGRGLQLYWRSGASEA